MKITCEDEMDIFGLHIIKILFGDELGNNIEPWRFSYMIIPTMLISAVFFLI